MLACIRRRMLSTEQTQETCSPLTHPVFLIALPSVCSTDTVEDDGIDNPFRPGGGLSREADIIVQMIKAGKQITPTSPTREDIRELEQELKRRQQADLPVAGELQRSESHTNDVSHAASNGTSDTRGADHTTNFSTFPNGNNNRPSSKPSSPKGSTGKSSTSASESNSREKDTLKKDAERSCCAVQ